MIYMALKHTHLLTVVLSLSLFVIRFVWVMRDSEMMNKKMGQGHAARGRYLITDHRGGTDFCHRLYTVHRVWRVVNRKADLCTGLHRLGLCGLAL